MAKQKRKLTVAEKRAKRQRKKDFMTIFVNGKQKRVPRPKLIDGLPVDEFIRQNADPIWLHQNGMWEYIDVDTTEAFDVTANDNAHRALRLTVTTPRATRTTRKCW
jgi:hypothetical protein